VASELRSERVSKERERVSQSAPRAAGLVNWGRSPAARYRLSVIGDQREGAAGADQPSREATASREASAAAGLWRDLPSSDYSEMLKLARCPLSLAVTLTALPSMLGAP
jgi:hypothetical protein